MTKTTRMLIIASLLSCFLIVGGALVVAQHRKNAALKAQAQSTQKHSVSRAELAKATGKDGKFCYVAVDGTVYEIKDFSLWQNGEHQTSNGLAYCGADMSKVIDKAPHGRKILDLLIVVGPLTS